ncbi:MAG: nucleoside monophosphate kinase [Bacteroidales bacterium]|nr:nucleoside monophosphate kinase [Bacteroidales bacterium]
MANIVIFGAPGVGKGTQAKLLAEKYDLLHISTGDLLRQEVQMQTPVGQRAQAIINRGDLVGDDIVVPLLDRALRLRSTHPDPDSQIDPWDRQIHGAPHRPEGCIIDGFPRTVPQAQTLEFLFRRMKRRIDLVLAIEVSRNELVRRIHERAAISGRTDDTEEVIRHRLDLYDRQTQPVLNYYRVSGLLVSVDGSGEIPDTNTLLCRVIDSKRKKQTLNKQ